ncbi:hypothetical protein BDR22DRAFT_885991 [Usnea florida]
MNLPTLIISLAALATATPLPWPDAKLEEINALRARGVSEADIASRHPQPLTSPPRAPLSSTISFFGRSSTMGKADVRDESGASDGRKGHFRESVGRRGEEIGRRRV